MVGTAAGKVVESLVRIVSSGPFARLAAWVVTMMVGIYVFVLWHEIADAAKEKAEAAKETAEEATDS